jgi:Protein of unknown function (DUF3575).
MRTLKKLLLVALLSVFIAGTAGAQTPSLAIRTNLLYDAFLIPTLGVEWRVNQNIGIKLDGSYSYGAD